MVKEHKCEHCGAIFDKPARLQRHELKHTGDRPFKCDRPGCDKTYQRKDHLVRHQKAEHDGQRPLECTQCDATFYETSHLKRHSLTHEVREGSPSLHTLACPVQDCGAFFADAAALQRHKAQAHTYSSAEGTATGVAGSASSALPSSAGSTQGTGARKRRRAEEDVNDGEALASFSAAASHTSHAFMGSSGAAGREGSDSQGRAANGTRRRRALGASELHNTHSSSAAGNDYAVAYQRPAGGRRALGSSRGRSDLPVPSAVHSSSSRKVSSGTEQGVGGDATKYSTAHGTGADAQLRKHPLHAASLAEQLFAVQQGSSRDDAAALYGHSTAAEGIDGVGMEDEERDERRLSDLGVDEGAEDEEEADEEEEEEEDPFGPGGLASKAEKTHDRLDEGAILAAALKAPHDSSVLSLQPALESTMFMCPFEDCGKEEGGKGRPRFSKRSELKGHWKSVHGDDVPFCTICGLAINNVNVMKAHGSGPRQCGTNILKQLDSMTGGGKLASGSAGLGASRARGFSVASYGGRSDGALTVLLRDTSHTNLQAANAASASSSTHADRGTGLGPSGQIEERSSAALVRGTDPISRVDHLSLPRSRVASGDTAHGVPQGSAASIPPISSAGASLPLDLGQLLGPQGAGLGLGMAHGASSSYGFGIGLGLGLGLHMHAQSASAYSTHAQAASSTAYAAASAASIPGPPSHGLRGHFTMPGLEAAGLGLELGLGSTSLPPAGGALSRTGSYSNTAHAEGGVVARSRARSGSAHSLGLAMAGSSASTTRSGSGSAEAVATGSG